MKHSILFAAIIAISCNSFALTCEEELAGVKGNFTYIAKQREILRVENEALKARIAIADADVAKLQSDVLSYKSQLAYTKSTYVTLNNIKLELELQNKALKVSATCLHPIAISYLKSYWAGSINVWEVELATRTCIGITELEAAKLGGQEELIKKLEEAEKAK